MADMEMFYPEPASRKNLSQLLGVVSVNSLKLSAPSGAYSAVESTSPERTPFPGQPKPNGCLPLTIRVWPFELCKEQL